MKGIAILIAICLIPVSLRPQEHSPATRTSANLQASSEVILGERLVREHEEQAGLGNTHELDGIPAATGAPPKTFLDWTTDNDAEFRA